MTTIEQLQNQINEMQKQLDELKAQSNAQTVGWTPEIGQICYSLCGNGVILQKPWKDELFQNDWLDQGNIFKTQVKAEKERDRRAVTKKLCDLAGGYKFVAGEKNHYILYDHVCKKLWVAYYIWNQDINTIYFPTEESARHAICVLGDELKKVL